MHSLVLCEKAVLDIYSVVTMKKDGSTERAHSCESDEILRRPNQELMNSDTFFLVSV